MNNVVLNQKKHESVEAGTSFRNAYAKAKYFKAWIWAITLILAVVQLVASVYSKKLNFDLTPIVVSLLVVSVIASTFGKQKVSEWHSLGCTIQRLHDHLVLNIGIKPSYLEVSKDTLTELSCEWLKNNPNDKAEFEKWWSVALDEVPFSVAKVICSLSTFSWEAELRKRYQKVLTVLLFASLIIPLIVAFFANYMLSQVIIFAVAPFTPFIAVVMDEWLENKNAEKIANHLTIECHSTWDNTLHFRLSSDEIMRKVDNHMTYWQEYRQSATPIFEWLYKRSQAKMEKTMVVNTDALIGLYLELNSESTVA
ncbi:S-4TM family putative pore-forming effector [Vibrio sp. 10N.222.55.B11]|uniref:S-4TM family putative pore-forming effector n=1 Tax=Vibrio sp. 10N.222.55.B11 TaxID=3229648 RepID=UPI00354DEF18